MGLLAPFLENRKSESTSATVATVATFQPPHRQKSRESQLSQPCILEIKIMGTASKRLPLRLHPLKSAARPCSAGEATIISKMHGCDSCDSRDSSLARCSRNFDFLGYIPATVATLQRPHRQRSRESQLSQGASLKTEIVTKPKVATVATVAALHPENQNYGYGVLLLHKGSGVSYLVASCLCTTLHGETAWREASPPCTFFRSC